MLHISCDRREHQKLSFSPTRIFFSKSKNSWWFLVDSWSGSENSTSLGEVMQKMLKKNESFYINRPNYPFVLYICYKSRVPLQKKTKSTINVFFFWIYITLHVKSHLLNATFLIISPSPKWFFLLGEGVEILNLFLKFCFFRQNVKAGASLTV